MTRPSAWDHVTEAKLERLYVTEKRGRAEVARIMGLTPNAIGAKLKRMGLLRPVSQGRAGPLKRAPQPLYEPGVAPIPPSLPPEPAALLSPPVPIRNGYLERHHCKFPLGTPGTEEFRFCGGKRDFPLPYCGFHNNIAFNIPTKRSA